ncbi:uncharacterized protein [Manis javanica]|uniref:uncharacterized protein n=1 Tax=Manis javanica TaxID=9974 RepID=UPI003C6D99F8
MRARCSLLRLSAPPAPKPLDCDLSNKCDPLAYVIIFKREIFVILMLSNVILREKPSEKKKPKQNKTKLLKWCECRDSAQDPEQSPQWFPLELWKHRVHFGAGHLSWRNLPGSRGPGRIRRAGNAGPLAVSPQARADRRGDGVRVRPAPEQLSEFAGGAALGPRALPEDKSGPQERLASFWRSRASVPGEVTGGLGGAAAQAQGRRREASGTAHEPALAARLRAEDAAAAGPLPPKVRHRRLLPSRPHSDADWTQGPADSPAAAAAAGRGLSIAPQQQFSSKVALAAEAEPCVRPPALIGPCVRCSRIQQYIVNKLRRHAALQPFHPRSLASLPALHPLVPHGTGTAACNGRSTESLPGAAS